MKERTMQRTLVLAAVAALALVAAPAARAKEITKAEVCGADGCRSAAAADREVLGNGGPPRTAPTAAPFYTVRVTVDTGEGQMTHWEMTAVPARRALLASDGTWLEMPSDVAAVVAKLAARRRPFPASDLIGAAAPAKPHSAAAGTGDSPLWPEGVLIAVVLAVGGVLLVRAVRGSRRFGPASG
jgi:hypothetical protein